MITRTRKLSDKKVVETLRSLVAEIEDWRVYGAYDGGVTFSADDETELAEISNKSNERIIAFFALAKGPGASDEIKFARGVTDYTRIGTADVFDQFFQKRAPDAYFDEIGILRAQNFQNRGGYKRFSDTESLSTARIISKLAAPTLAVDKDAGEAFSKAIDQNITDLQELSAQFISRMAEARADDEKAFRQKQTALQKDFDSKSKDLEAARKSLEKRREELNDREPQHERRRLRESVTTEVKTYLQTPDDFSIFKSNGTNLLYLFAGLIFLAVSVILTLRIELSSNASDISMWLNSLKGLATGVGGAAFIWAGLSGTRRVAKEREDHRRKMQNYAYDMDRASWVVETILHLNGVESAQVPDVWLEAVCANLFGDESNGANATPDSLEALGALLDATARAKVGTDGFQFELDKAGSKKLAQQAR